MGLVGLFYVVFNYIFSFTSTLGLDQKSTPLLMTVLRVAASIPIITSCRRPDAYYTPLSIVCATLRSKIFHYGGYGLSAIVQSLILVIRKNLKI